MGRDSNVESAGRALSSHLCFIIFTSHQYYVVQWGFVLWVVSIESIKQGSIGGFSGVLQVDQPKPSKPEKSANQPRSSSLY